ncbi:MAG TPA: hypothetical protein VMV47_00495 [Bacteroidales bacterium]|nr:hypothetical protein [Bacteroidales bacterium]
MNRKTTLSIDALINLTLAILLLLFSPKMADFFGIPSANNNFYPNILGAVFFGITIALIIEAFRNPSNNNKVGLGLIGAVCINLSGGFVLLLWLVFGNMSLPLKGNLFLWTLDLILLLISTIELFNIMKKK